MLSCRAAVPAVAGAENGTEPGDSQPECQQALVDDRDSLLPRFPCGAPCNGRTNRPAVRVEADAGVRVMTKSEGSRVHRHPDAVDCLEGLPEDGAAVHPPLVRRHADGLTRYWTGGARCGAATSRGTARRMRFWRRSRRSSVRCCRGWRRTWARARPTWTAAGARSGTPRRAAARRR